MNASCIGRASFVVCALLACSAGVVQLAVAGRGLAQGSPAERLDFLSHNVVLIAQGGSGFLVERDLKNRYLVTAAHVARHARPDASVHLRAVDGTPIAITVRALAAPGATWTAHPTADVAILPVDPEVELGERFLPLSSIRPGAPSPSQPVIVIGFPIPDRLRFSRQAQFSPIWREAAPGSHLLTLERLDTRTPEDFYILQDPSVGGFSGSPIIDLGAEARAGQGVYSQQTWGDITCWGLMHGVVGDRSGGKFAYVVPGSKMLELINQSAE